MCSGNYCGRWANVTVTDQYCVDYASSMNQLWFSIEYSIINESSMIIILYDQCWSTLIISHYQKFYIRSTLIIIYNLWSRIDSYDSILIFSKHFRINIESNLLFLRTRSILINSLIDASIEMKSKHHRSTLDFYLIDANQHWFHKLWSSQNRAMIECLWSHNF